LNGESAIGLPHPLGFAQGRTELKFYCSLDANDARRQTLGGDSVFGAIEIPDAGNESTFMMVPVESPVRDTNTTETAGIEVLDDNGPLFDMDHDDNDDHVNEPMDMHDWDSGDEPDDEPDNTNLGTAEERISQGTADLAPRRVVKRKLGKKISRHGIEYPSLPPSVVKRLATTLAKTAGNKGKLKPDTLEAITQATDWFFEQLGDDLSAYAKHAGRKTIDDSDMITLMRRFATHSPFMLPVFCSRPIGTLYANI
jgi:histone H3/H4